MSLSRVEYAPRFILILCNTNKLRNAEGPLLKECWVEIKLEMKERSGMKTEEKAHRRNGRNDRSRKEKKGTTIPGKKGKTTIKVLILEVR